MRKYRGLTKEGKWVYGWYVEAVDYYKEHKHFIVLRNSRYYPFIDGDEKIIEPREYSVNIVEVIPETVSQQTGLKAKNGTEIYEGDILQLSFETLELRGVVQQTESGKWELYKDEGNHIGVHHNISRVTVIGNIHQNPELMEQE